MTIKTHTTERIQETCRALRPVIGKQADQLWQAYIFSDEDGKVELEEQIDLLANAKLNADVQNTTPIFLPPHPDVAGGQVELGTVQYNGKTMCPFGLSLDELTQHTAIVGRTGSGKSNTGFLLANNLAKNDIGWLVLDWKRSWRDMLALPGFENAKIYTVGRDVAPIRINPLICPNGIEPKNWIKALVATIGKAYFCGQGVEYLLTTVIDELYQEFGVYDCTVTSYPTFRDVLERLKRLPARGREGLWLSSALRAIHSISFGSMDDIFNSSSTVGIDELLNGHVILELESLQHADKLFFTGILLLEIYAHRLTENKRGHFQHALIIEEAHHLLSSLRQSGGEPASIVEVIFREIREFGEGIVFLDQVPSEISRTALANTYTSIALNLKGRPDVSTMASAMLLDKDQERVLGEMPVGKAIVKLQGRVPNAFMINIPEFKMPKGTVTDAQIHELMAPHIPAIPEAGVLDSITDDELRFIEDIALVPDCGVSARYSRLHMSGRQGDKTRNTLLEKGLIRQEEKVTKTGRTKVIRLTEEVEDALKKQRE